MDYGHVPKGCRKPTEIIWIRCKGKAPARIDRHGYHVSIGKMHRSQIGSS